MGNTIELHETHFETDQYISFAFTLSNRLIEAALVDPRCDCNIALMCVSQGTSKLRALIQPSKVNELVRLASGLTGNMGHDT